MGFIEDERAFVRGFYPTFEWIESAAPTIRTAPPVPLERARVALVTTAGAYVTGQTPFDRGDDGDPSCRCFAADARIRFSHPGFDTVRAYRDPDVVVPLVTLAALASDGIIGAVAPRVFSFMGYVPDPTTLLAESAPRVARELLADAVDLALLVPA